MGGRWLLVAAVGLVGCLRARIVECEDGVVCPLGDVCDDAHHGCATPAQLAACDGVPDGTDCAAGAITGGCFGGVCLHRGCGNGVVEPGEQCDDGNQTSDDGCSGDCKSNETCGNGVLDDYKGEQCDDGNLMSHDGCDSRCFSEQVSWSLIPIAPSRVRQHVAAYDRGRGRLVVEATGTTWEFDGALWYFALAAGDPNGLPYYDPDRGQVVTIGPASNQAFAWNGTQWMQLTNGPGPSDPVATTYDAVNHRPVVLTPSQTWTFDATGAWSQLAAPPIPVNYGVAAFDDTTGTVVVLAAGSTIVELDFDGTWTQGPTPFNPTDLQSIAFDNSHGKVVGLDNTSGLAYQRTAPFTWSTLPGGRACNDPSTSGTPDRVLYEPTSTLVLVAQDASATCTLGATWTQVPIQAPVGASAIAAKPGGGFVVQQDAPISPNSESWIWNGAWQHLVSSQPQMSRQGQLMMYDPARGATICYGGTSSSGDLHDTWSFDGSDWIELDPSPAGQSVPVWGAYDPIGQNLLQCNSKLPTQCGGSAILELSSTASQWAAPSPVPSMPSVTAMAYAGREGAQVAVSGMGTETAIIYEQSGGTWQPLTLVPNVPFTSMYADERTGGAVLIAPETGAVWERRSGTWLQRETLPLIPIQDIPSAYAYDPSDGSLAMLANLGYDTGALVAVRKWSSSTPFESCNPGEDLDGDGLAGCDDPDCYWRCTPSCLPYTTCP
ncbi:MAG TPA: DUF4215 domain-containing protein [Kofleriaceae bacterium]|nr:DUF4215 domain-containing protein [Kofleriaceae bacterium]